jgi:hypothetical protein
MSELNDIEKIITNGNYFENNNKLMMMCCMPMCRLPGMGDLPM